MFLQYVYEAFPRAYLQRICVIVELGNSKLTPCYAHEENYCVYSLNLWFLDYLFCEWENYRAGSFVNNVIMFFVILESVNPIWLIL